ncbi:M23 family metallopeptidase [Falsirhodobacter xinxiangensis]|uniref:M23 family metallopeptidase n=1 Tax=Falsirhodobacter xinxiangensis TaxID=2530049 RepID=UPI0010AA73BA|nr:M23 family metallopeptidase [Rhodobacter xinxiangensis]
MLTRLTYRLNTSLERWLPEQRLFLKSGSQTRFIRIRPLTQIALLTGSVAVIGWTIVASSIAMMDGVSTGSGKVAAARQQALFETRLNALSADRDLRAEEAARAQDRFSLALAEVSQMQERLLKSEDQRREMETGIEVIQNTLRRTIDERDEARAEVDRVTLAMAGQTGGDNADAGETLEMVTEALNATARQRDDLAEAALVAKAETERVIQEKTALEARNDVIFSQLEDAVSVSMEPLDKMFAAAGLNTNDLLRQVRRGYSGQGGPLAPVSLSTMSGAAFPEESRANAILEGLDRMNMYRLAAAKAPLAMPVTDRFRYSSGFGYRRDPKGAGRRMHSGIDMAAPIGTPILVTGDGVVTQAGWANGYGRMITVRHDFGIETRYAHLSKIDVSVGDRVSRGDHIGDMGSSGRSTGSHLHYEVRIGGEFVNPMTFIKAAKDVF